MKKRNLFLSTAAALAATMIISSASAAVPSGYYDSLEGLSGVNLKKAAKKVARNHTAVSYGDDTWDAFKKTDTRYVNNQLVWWDMYSNNLVAVSSGHGGLNIEHSVANSWWGGGKNDAYKDLFHLNPSNADANNRKSNYPLGEIQTVTWNNGVTFVGKPASGDCGGATYVYEPADEYKGDFARVFFYMFTIYDDISWTSQWNWMYDTSSDYLLKPWAYKLLLKWSEEDPVSQKEIDRNEEIYKIQKNRNPFIDCPNLAQYIWGSMNNTPYHFDNNYEPGTDPQPDPGTDPDDPNVDPEPTPTGYWYAVTSIKDLNEEDLYVIVSTEDDVAMSYTLGSSSKFLQPCGSTPTIDRTSSPARLTDVPADAAVLRLKSAGTGWTLSVGDLKGNSKGYLQSTEMKNVTIVPSGGSVAQITPTSEKCVVSFNYSGNSTGNLEYNSSAPRFTTYSSNQQQIRLYRLKEEKGTAGLSTGLETEPEIIGIYDINGRKMNVTDTDLLDSGIYIVVSNFGTRKIKK